LSAALSTFGEVLPDRRGPDEGKLLSERAFGNIMAARPEVALIACRQDHWGRVGDHPNRRLHENRRSTNSGLQRLPDRVLHLLAQVGALADDGSEPAGVSVIRTR